MYKQNTHESFYETDNFNQLQIMYEWLSKGYQNTQKRLAEVLEENQQLKNRLIEKDRERLCHPFID